MNPLHQSRHTRCNGKTDRILRGRARSGNQWKGKIRRKRGDSSAGINPAERSKHSWDRDGQSPQLGPGSELGSTYSCEGNGYLKTRKCI